MAFLHVKNVCEFEKPPYEGSLIRCQVFLNRFALASFRFVLNVRSCLTWCIDNISIRPIPVTDAKAHYLAIYILSKILQVLKTDDEIMEIDNSGFSTQYPTVYTGNIGNNRFIVQV